MPTEPRVKLGDTELVKALRATVHSELTPMQEVIVCQTYCTELYRVPGETFDVQRRLTPAGHALLAAAELWDALPEAQPNVVANLIRMSPHMDPVNLWWQCAANFAAAALEAQRREAADAEAS